MQLIIRTLYIGVAVLTLVLALLLSAGRFLTWQLTDAQVNRWLAPQGLKVSGLKARWHLLNPVVELRGLTLGDSQLDGVALELDWVESLLRTTLVLRHLSVEQGALEVAYLDDRGWHLAGTAGGAAQQNWFATVYESDELQYKGLVNFTRNEHRGGLQVNGALVNRGGTHRIDITLADPNCPQSCQLRLRFDDREALWPLWYRELAASASTSGSGITLPSPLLAGTTARLSDFQLRWDRTATRLGSGIAADAGIGAGVNFTAKISDITVPGGRPFALELAADGTSIGGIATSRVHAVRLTQGAGTHQPLASSPQTDTPQTDTPQTDNSLVLPAVWLQWTPNDMRLFAPSLALDPLAQFFAQTRLPQDALKEWLDALAISGGLTDVRVQRAHNDGLLSYAADFVDVEMRGHKGVPLLRDAQGHLAGHSHGVGFTLAGPELTLGFPDLFLEPWVLEDFSGRLHLWRRNAVLRIVGSQVEAKFDAYQSDVPNRLHMTFAMELPPEREAQLLNMQVRMNQTSLTKAKTFLPTKLNPELRRWLISGPQSGTLTDVDFAYIGHVRGDQGARSRRAVMQAKVQDAAVVYHEAWPLVRDIVGDLQLSGSRAQMDLVRARTQDIQLGAGEITVATEGSNAVLQLLAEFDVAAGLNFVRQTPLADTVTFIGPQWSGSGQVVAKGAITVPIRAQPAVSDQAGEGVSAKLNFALRDANLTLPEYRMPLTNILGNVNFQTPTQVSASGVRGALFGSPWRADINTEQRGNADIQTNRAIVFGIEGQMQPQGVYQLLGLEDPGIASGDSGYRAILRFPTNGAAASLQLNSDMSGTELRLPGQLAKAAGEPRGLSLQAQFGSQRSDLAVRYPGLVGAFQVEAGSVRRGALQLAELGAVATPMPQFDSTAEYVALAGTLTHFDVAAVSAGDGILGQVPFEIERLEIGDLTLDETSLGAVEVNGSLQGTDYDLDLQGERIRGELLSVADEPLVIRLASLRVPASDVGGDLETAVTPDPLSTELIDQLPYADVVIEELWVGEEAYGRWQFLAEPQDGDLIVEQLQAQTKGLNINADTVRWVGKTDRTEFVGKLIASDLADVMPQFGYAPSLSTASASVDAEVSWAGSPLNFELAAVNGELLVGARDGRFLDVATGNNAQRIFSLLNFGAITKRMSLDFSDILGKGVSFDRLGARIAMGEGELNFIEPMEVKGTGSSFRLDGRVNVVSGELDNDMIVTLPVSKGLPWYAAYVALANPLAGLGVLVGERVLRKPLEQFSSAKYHVSGTVDDPEVKLVNVFDNRMDGDSLAAGKEEPSANTDRTNDAGADLNGSEMPLEPDQGSDPNINNPENGTP